MNVGILGGTFEPIHIGHVSIATHVLEAFRLDSILLIPAGEPWLKTGRVISNSYHRLAMADLVAKEHPRIFVSDIEINRLGPSFTADTLEELHITYGLNLNLSFILGMDSYNDISLWHNPSRLFELATFIVVSRPGIKLAALNPIEKGIIKNPESIKFLTGPNVNISASEIRRRVAEGYTIDGWVPDDVRRYIEKHGLNQKKV